MNLDIPFKWSLLTVSVVGIILTSIIIFSVRQGVPIQTLHIKSETSLPVRLKIPKINIDAPVESVGLAPDGAMDVPSGPWSTAWFNLGPRLGEKGSAVIDGHSGWKNNLPAVFDNLYKLDKGDKIYIEDESDETFVFVVRELRMYGKDDETRDVFISNDGKSHLNLITCSGAWDSIEQSSSDRLVVFADMEIN